VLDKVVEQLLGPAIDKVLERAVEFGRDTSAAGVGASEPGLERAAVAEVMRRVLAGAADDELTEALRKEGLARPLIPEWIGFLRAQARERVEEPLFRLAVGLGVFFQLAVLLAAVTEIASGEKATDTPFFWGLMFLAGLAFLGMKAAFPKWFEVHEALGRRKASVSQRLTAARLALCLGAVAGQHWYLGHCHSSKARPWLIVAAIATCVTGVPLVLSWLQAYRWLRMSDEEYARRG